MDQNKNCGLYVHVPFCRKKCLYCDFFSAGSQLASWGRLVDAFLNELEARRNEFIGNVDTLYIGGGTPSLMPKDEFLRLCTGIRTILHEKMTSLGEFTIEVNPDDVTEEMCEVWLGCGVNRVSMGVQSMIDSELKSIGRLHDSRCAKDAALLLRDGFDNLSLDLMFGLPGQTMESWRHSVEEILTLNPDHISAYSLMLEDGTPMTVLTKNGRVTLPPEECYIKMWKLLSEKLAENGFRQYEISNYAKPGYESRHNSGYWLGKPYVGIGPSAHSYDGGNVRKSNPADLRGYLDCFAPDSKAKESHYTPIVEKLSAKELMEEHIMTRLRMADGIDINEYENKFGANERRRLFDRSGEWLGSGLLVNDDDHLRLSDEAVMVSDEIIVGLLP